MKKVFTMHLCAYSSQWDPQSQSWHLGSSPMNTNGFTCVGEREVEVDVPDQFPVADIVVALRAEISVLRADAQVKINKIEDHIGKLLSLPAPSESGYDDIPF